MALRERAAEWVLRLEACTDPSDRARLQGECDRWLQADPRRRQIFAELRDMNAALEGNRTVRRRWRRNALAVLLMLAPLLAPQLPWQAWTADHRTAYHEVGEITLADGTRLVLDAGTAVDVAFDAQRRVVELHRGGILVQVAADPGGRPFVVHTPHGEALALGTVYEVRRRPADSLVSVMESQVRVVPDSGATMAVTLSAGQRAGLTRTAVGPLEAVEPDAFAWADRRLVFNDTPLADVLERLERYHPGLVRMSGRLAARGLRFTGVLPLDDDDRALRLLSTALGLEVTQLTDYLVYLDRAEGGS